MKIFIILNYFKYLVRIFILTATTIPLFVVLTNDSFGDCGDGDDKGDEHAADADSCDGDADYGDDDADDASDADAAAHDA